ncbi:hypothetical protein LTS12_027362 [Elasticomyces elasticus]|nr:hypothetical protein LTS12_027362 [Elasticomyces elasticus]
MRSRRLSYKIVWILMNGPIKKAPMDPQGEAGGRCGATWQVLYVYKEPFRHFEDLKICYPLHLTAEPDDLGSEHYLRFNIKSVWTKLIDRYEKLDDTPVYVAEVVLHPRVKWRWIEKRWSTWQDWIVKAKSSFTK